MSDTEGSYLSQLDEETMRRAWGERTPEDRRRIITAAMIFGRQLDARLAQTTASPALEDTQRFLMSLMNAVVDEFAEREEIDRNEAASFLGDVTNRDHILEFNEVIEDYETGDSNKSLDALLREAIRDRREKAIWSGHWSSG
ncbi:MAG TPA: hypothetical protein VFJ72_04275 [Rubrobacteraceae bacterium]|nr:hypothetical protein [Rubrobacteraceae bacterium]